MKRCRYIVFLLLAGMVGQGCSSRAIHEAEAVVAQADSLWHEGKQYGIDEGDSATLAQAYEKLGGIPLPFRTLLGVGSSDSYAHACYHYGKLLRAKDHSEEAMQAFINATHSRTHDYNILGRVYSNMGDLCHLAGDFQLSYDMYERSGQMYLLNGDSLLYFYDLNNMAYELAEQGKKDSCFNIIVNIKNHASYDSVLLAYCWITQAQACLKCKQYDSLIFYAQQSKQIASTLPSSSLQLAQAYSYLGKRDSATYYALFVLNNTNELFDVNNALYILTNDDMSKDKDAIRETAAARSDTQKILEIRQGKMSQAVQLLELDLAKTPDLRWLYAVIATVLIIGAAIVVYVYRKHKKHDLLAQKISDLTLKSNAVQANHEKLVNRYESQHQRREEETLHRCALLRNCPQIAVELKWNDFDSVSNIIDNHFYLLATKLRQKAVLNETEIRLCILVLIGLNRSQIANTMPYALNSIGKLKDQTAKKLGTSGKNLRDFLIKIVVDE